MGQQKPVIGGIVVNAPVWRGATEADLRHIVECLSRASYHYADDSGREWGRATALKQEAAQEVNRLKLPMMAIEALHRDKPQLVPLRDFTDAILSSARALSPGDGTQAATEGGT